ncbi:MAG: hypothetical protein QMC81_11210 [Thermoanaerobacterales bacterium]|nr:hypothetical protein [Bacillota bacterium]MDI6908037.1 hypothetical protein [Thermoanaerobacterales bacterium]
MKARAFYCLSLVFVLLAGILSAGCRQGPEMTLARAFVQGVNTDSYTAAAQIQVQLEPVNILLEPDERRIIDLINASRLTVTTRANVPRREQSAAYTLSVQGQTLQTTFYSSPDGVWFRDPFAPRYVDLGSFVMTPEIKQFQDEMAKALTPAVREFLGGYIPGLESPVTVADLGEKTLTTPAGAVRATHLQVRMNDAQAKKFFFDATERLILSERFPDLVITVLRFAEMPGAAGGPALTPQDEARMREEWAAAKEQMLADLTEARLEASRVQVVGERGLLFDFFVDRSNNIRRMETAMHFSLRGDEVTGDPLEKGVFNATLRASMDFNDINSLGPLAFPAFTAADTVTPMEFMAEFDPAQLPPVFRELLGEPGPAGQGEPVSPQTASLNMAAWSRSGSPSNPRLNL